ncbi:carboxypeptidase regulatory-like domain-containing protein [Micromonospora harpali]|uniref:carboxypeptidase regulatory-like domain-containing protein n=1 Tax=Micromonospora harpali TaxID=1490225 RepID=UPI00338FA1CB
MALAIGALLAVPATPVLAAEVSVTPGSINLNAGSDATVSVKVTPSNDDASAQISLTGLPAGVSCTGGCGQISFNGQAPRTQLLTIKASDSAPDAGGINVTVQVQPDKSDSTTGSFQLNVKGKTAPTTPAQTQTVKSVSGKVVAAANGEAVPNAIVMLQDSTGAKFETTSNGSGNFSFTGSTDKPIVPGRLSIGAIQGDVRVTKSFTASAGQSISGQRLSLAIKVEVSPSPSPSASEEPLPSDEATDDATEEPTEAAPGAANNAASTEEDSGMSWLLILLGGLFVAIGVGTIVLLWMKRRENGDDVDDAPKSGAAAAGAIPAARGAYGGADDQTRVVNRVGAGPDPTMVGGTSLSDAPTMMHRPVVDDVPPDPYGAPPAPYGAGGPPQQGGWAGGGYGDEPQTGGYGAAGGYGNAPASGGGYGGAPASGGGYGNPSGGYGADAPASGGGYSNAGGYGAEAPASGGGYGGAPASGGGYGGAPASGGGYGSTPASGGYGSAPASGGGYGSAPASGGGYGTAPASGGGYGNPGGYGAEAAPTSSGGGYGNRDYSAPAGAPAGGYPGQGGGGYGGERYDEPTGRYTGDTASSYPPPAADPYPTSTYQAEQGHGGYGQPEPPQYGGRGGEPTGGYGAAEPTGGGYGGGGYGQHGQHGQHGQQGGGYDAGQQQGGYDQRGGYGAEGYGQQSGYGQQGGYGQEPPQQRGGYDDRSYEQQPTGYDQQQGGYYGDQAQQQGRGRPDGPPPPQQQDRGGRRLDWLDD